MKKSQKMNSAQSQDLNKEKKSLFNAIVDNESNQLSEFEIQKYCSRVGLVFKVLVNRDLPKLRMDFEQEITGLVKLYCEKIDNELSQTEKDS